VTSTPPVVPLDPPSSPTRIGPVLIAAAAGIGVAVALGVYGRVHTPTGFALNLAGFSSGLAVKSWLATLTFLAAIVQLVTGLAMFGRIPLHGAWLGPVHRWSGRVAVLVAVPIAVHCLYALGFQDFSIRALVHSLLGCFFFGAFVAKMLILTRDDPPGWALPVAGGLVFTLLTGLWLTASVWFFAYRGFTL
jgi:hypothetical protein